MSKQPRKPRQTGTGARRPATDQKPVSPPAKPGRSKWIVLLILLVPILAAAIAGVVYWQMRDAGTSSDTQLRRPPALAWQPQATAGPAAGYAGSASCVECHQGISESFNHMAIGRSLYKPTPDNIIEDYTANNEFYHEASQQYFRMLNEGDKFYQVRFQKDPSGNIINELKAEVAYIVGSGNNARSYLHEEPDGKLYQLPVAWYPQEKRWAMNPGYDSPHHFGFTRRITYECLFCHAGAPALEPGADRFNYGETSFFPTGEMHSIDCERCHGPAQNHVDLARAGASAEELKDSIVNPGNLSPELQLDTCMQCHLETTSNKLPHSVQAVGRGIYSYRPGEPLGDYRVNFDHPKGVGHDDKFEIAGQAYRMRMSKCFTDSSHGQMTCTTCHDPHRVPKDRIANGIQSCRTCHIETQNDCSATIDFRATANNNCIHCHMPRRRTDDAVHVVMTDHFIQRFRASEEELLAPRKEAATSYKGRVELYYPTSRGDDLEQLYLGLAHVVDEADIEHGLQLLNAYLDNNEEVFEAVFVRGIALKVLGIHIQSLKELERAVELMPTIPQVHMALGDLHEQMGNYQESITRYRKAVELAPTLARAHNGLGASLHLAGDLDGAIASYRKAMAVDPFDEKAHFNLANVYLQRGDYTAAEAASRTGLTIQPNVPAAWQSLAQALTGLDRRHEAAWHCAEAIRLQPENATFFQFLSELIVTMEESTRMAAMKPVQDKAPFAGRVLMAGLQTLIKQNDIALQYLLEAEAYQTTNSAVYAYAGQVAVSVDRPDIAEKWLRAAIDLDPAMEDAIVSLASALRAQGREADAEVLLRDAMARADTPSARLLNAMAWLRATANDATLRDGAEAESLARQAAQRLDRPNLFVQGTLAAALAEQGKFNEARSAAADAIQLARDSNRPADVAQLEAQLAEYSASRPYRSQR